MLQEETEQTTYINTILATGPIRSLMNFLVSKGNQTCFIFFTTFKRVAQVSNDQISSCRLVKGRCTTKATFDV